MQQLTSTQTGSLPVSYGFGWFTDGQPGGPFGHGGAHKTDMHVFPRQQLVTVLMVQHTEWRNGDGGKILPTFQQAAIRTFGVASTATPNTLTEAERKAGWKLLFDGKTLNGWHASAQTGHSRASGNKSGGRWVAEDGMIVGSQDIPGNGGILLTDEKFGDYEVVLEMKNDFGPDSGLFLRCDEKGNCYQAMIDYHVGGNLMGLYGEGNLGAKPSVRNFTFWTGRTISSCLPRARKGRCRCPSRCPWRIGRSSGSTASGTRLRARIMGNPPHITTWIKGVTFMDWTEPVKRHPGQGSIGLQVHGGGDFTKQFVRYRNLRIKRLDASGQSGGVLSERGGAAACLGIIHPEQITLLYASLLRAPDYYERHQASRSCLYSDAMIVSPRRACFPPFPVPDIVLDGREYCDLLVRSKSLKIWPVFCPYNRSVAQSPRERH